jgi:HemK-like putative methylase
MTELIERVATLLREAARPEAADYAAMLVEAAAGDMLLALDMVRRHCRGAPLGLLTGHVDFLGVDVVTGPDVLAPRRETEILGQLALSLLPGDGDGLTVLDVCCGAGNLACALATHRQGLRVFASDLTDSTVALARANANRLGLTNRVTVTQGDLFAPLAGRGLGGTVDLIVCNPPYISSGRLAKEAAGLLEHEPREAFDGGPYGLSIHQRVMSDATHFLRPGGWLCFEFGLGQDRQIELLFQRARRYGGLRYAYDSAGQPRAAAAYRLPA